MTNTELIDGLRWCADESICCDDFSGEKCPYFDEKKDSCSVDEILHAAADALEAAEKRIVELEKELEIWTARSFEGKIGSMALTNLNLKKEIYELKAQLPKWTMLKDEMPKPHTNVLVSGIEAINNVRVYKVMVNDNGTLRPTDYAPSIRWDCWMPFESPNCGARMKGEQHEQ